MNITRRGFIGRFLAGACGVVIGSSLISMLINKNRREMLIADAFDTPEGRVLLSKAMVEPIRRKLREEAIGRKIFHMLGKP